MIVNDQDEVLMLWRDRFPTDQWGYELLGGLVEEGEAPAATAAREAAEESGWEPIGEPEELISFEPLPGQLTARTDMYLWHGAPLDNSRPTSMVGLVEAVSAEERRFTREDRI